jgi:hypothetical protein
MVTVSVYVLMPEELLVGKDNFSRDLQISRGFPHRVPVS